MVNYNKNFVKAITEKLEDRKVYELGIYKSFPIEDILSEILG